ncbi:hypothetical protein NE850_23115 [Paraburkholderia sp. USG1]|uniref:hypothetical protein n=1 Tax=Paraburkholderia sp. USG1 TaxID=2952268 RepID=UPI0028595178|nr:hypothetical protein [Paraburkholderia sp. USG1]MDR8399216.1 hypothetical protein [Paraburkholderia sp. USG1]
MSDTYICSTNVPFPPARCAVPYELAAGTVTKVECNGPCSASVFNAQGALLLAIETAGKFSWPVSWAFTGGAPYVVQQTPSDITFTITE